VKKIHRKDLRQEVDWKSLEKRRSTGFAEVAKTPERQRTKTPKTGCTAGGGGDGLKQEGTKPPSKGEFPKENDVFS